MTPQRVLVVEDDRATAAFICQQLSEGGLAPETVRGGLEALRKAHSHSFALALVDVDIASDPDGVETADWLRRLYGVPVVVFSMRGDRMAGELPGVVSSVLAAVLSKRTLPPTRHAQSRMLSPDGSLTLSSESPANIAMPSGFAELSGREWQIIRDLIETPSAQAVALKRQRSPHTVHNHLKSIFRKLHVHSVAELLSLMIRVTRQVPML